MSQNLLILLCLNYPAVVAVGLVADDRTMNNAKEATHGPLWAFIFSLLFPGLGQFYNNEMAKALVFFGSFMVLSYVFLPVGILITLGAAIDAYRKANTLKKRGFRSERFVIAVIVLVVIFFVAGFIGFFAPAVFNIGSAG